MACGCGSGQDAEMWEVVFADSTVSNPQTKTEATAAAQRSGGSWIRRVTRALAS
jgi:hypothetical protein